MPCIDSVSPRKPFAHDAMTSSEAPAPTKRERLQSILRQTGRRVLSRRQWTGLVRDSLVRGSLVLGSLATTGSVVGQTPTVAPPPWYQQGQATVSQHEGEFVSWSQIEQLQNQTHPPANTTPPDTTRPNTTHPDTTLPAPSSTDPVAVATDPHRFAAHRTSAPYAFQTAASPIASASQAANAPSPTSNPPIATALGFAPPPTLATATWNAVPSAEAVYDDKKPVPTQYPWIEWGRPFYGPGLLPPGGTIFGPYNLTHQTFYLYGDYRVGFGSGRNAASSFDNVATRLNLDMNWEITSTERLHAFVGPLNNGGQFSQVTIQDGQLEFDPIVNLNPVTGFFEGDLGYMLGGLADTPAQFDMPIAAGLMPLFYQNGIWMDDAVTGLALAQNAKHSNLLNWSNYDATVFAIFDQLDSPAFGQDNHAAQALGTAWFIEAYGGYLETGYAYVYDRKEQGRTYHNATMAFTRRYFDRIGNSIRVIINAGQDLAKANRTADGGVILLENYWITATPVTLVPYCNLFYGWGRPQSLARNGLAGGILRNTGINFETDGLNGFPTLDPTAINTFGGAIGVNMIGANIDKQLIVEAALVQAYGSDNARVALGNQYGLGARYQQPLSNCTLIRFDAMIGWREHEADLYGGRVEYRYKF